MTLKEKLIEAVARVLAENHFRNVIGCLSPEKQEWCRAMSRECFVVYEATLSEAGWKTVPREPTEKMKVALFHAGTETAYKGNQPIETGLNPTAGLRAVIDAAPGLDESDG